MKRKPPGYDKDVRTALIFNEIGRTIGVNLAPNYLANCHPKVRTAVKRKLRRTSTRDA